MDYLCYMYFCLVLLCFHARMFVDASRSSAGKRLTFLIMTLTLSHWYTGSGVVLDCIDS